MKRVLTLLSLMQQGKTPGLLSVFSCLLCLGCYSKTWELLGHYERLPLCSSLCFHAFCCADPSFG
uniref:Uncharacterized protein n=1 Tax=Arundo donax TaxID=35708 RepID=A0A0A9EEW0_ARUDO